MMRFAYFIVVVVAVFMLIFISFKINYSVRYDSCSGDGVLSLGSLYSP